MTWRRTRIGVANSLSIWRDLARTIPNLPEFFATINRVVCSSRCQKSLACSLSPTLAAVLLIVAAWIKQLRGENSFHSMVAFLRAVLLRDVDPGGAFHVLHDSAARSGAMIMGIPAC